jgi:hypothetical protein
VRHPMLLSHLLLLAVAPIPYLVLGSPLLLVGDGRRASDWLCPLLGCVLAGWLSEVSLVLGVPCRFTLAVAYAASVVVFLARFRESGRLVRCLAGLLVAYLPAAAILALNASPASTSFWLFDWSEQYAMGQGVLLGDYHGAPIHREPLFAAGAIPLQLVFADLSSLMAFSAVTAGAGSKPIRGAPYPTASLIQNMNMNHICRDVRVPE